MSHAGTVSASRRSNAKLAPPICVFGLEDLVELRGVAGAALRVLARRPCLFSSLARRRPERLVLLTRRGAQLLRVFGGGRNLVGAEAALVRDRDLELLLAEHSPYQPHAHAIRHGIDVDVRTKGSVTEVLGR